jgi:hypothetical protein
MEAETRNGVTQGALQSESGFVIGPAYSLVAQR